MFSARAASTLLAIGMATSAHAGAQLNLLSAGATGTNGGATYTQVAPQPTGSGYIDPFVRIGMPGGQKNVVEAYNTTVNDVFNNSSDDTFNHAITFGQMAVFGSGGNQYVRFLLDINQINSTNGRFLNLDEIQIFVSNAPNQSVTSFSGTTGLLGLGGNAQLVYRLDNGKVTDQSDMADAANDRITLDYSLNHGSGSGDMFLDIPIAMFNAAFTAGGYSTTSAKNAAYVYLYSKFGSDPYNNNDGFEEWAFLRKTPLACPDGQVCGSVAAPGPLSLIGFGLLGLAAVRRRREPSATVSFA